MIHPDWTYPDKITPEFYERLNELLLAWHTNGFIDCPFWNDYNMSSYYHCDHCEKYFNYKSEKHCPCYKYSKEDIIGWIKECIRRYEDENKSNTYN